MYTSTSYAPLIDRPDPALGFYNNTRRFLAIPIDTQCCQASGICGEQYQVRACVGGSVANDWSNVAVQWWCPASASASVSVCLPVCACVCLSVCLSVCLLPLLPVARVQRHSKKAPHRPR